MPPDANISHPLITDVLIVGGGPAGLTLAAALGSAGVAVAVIDRDPPEKHLAATFDGRTIALSFGSRQVLTGAGVWPLMADEAGPILDIRVADQMSPLFLHYDHRAVGDQPLGWIVESRLFRKALLARVRALPSVTHLAPMQLETLRHDAEGVEAHLADGRVIRARLAVGADGKHSFCRANAGIKTRGHSYGQTAIVCTIGHAPPHNGLALEHFLPGGPFAVLPMTGNRCSIVWAERTEQVTGYLALPDDAFIAELQQRIGGWLGDIQLIGSRFSYPLALQYAETYIAPRLALVGDAAHAIHPIAGQGFNMGVRDVAALAEAIVDAARLGLDVGTTPVLERYQRWRRADNMTLIILTDALTRLFSNDIAPLKLARDLGLAAVNRLPPLKRFFIRHAMGTVGTLPRLVRGEKF